MSLVKLLTVGRSFVGAKDEAGRYKMSADCRLPQFGAARSDADGSGSDNAKADSSPKPAVPGPGFWRRLWKRFKPSGGVSPFRSAPNPDTSAAMGRKRARALNKSRRRPALFSFRDKPGSVERQLVQTEFGLEKIRVVRNDLSDADLQVVTAPPKAVPSAAPEISAMHTADSRFQWNRLTARLFVAGRARLE